MLSKFQDQWSTMTIGEHIDVRGKSILLYFVVQCNPFNGFTVGPARNWTNKRIEPLSDIGLLREHNKMGLAKSWHINPIEPLSGDQLSGLHCIWILINKLLKSPDAFKQDTGWPVSLCKTFRWLQNKSFTLAWPGQARPKQNFCFKVNGRFCSSWMVTLYFSCVAYYEETLKKSFRQFVPEFPISQWTLDMMMMWSTIEWSLWTCEGQQQIMQRWTTTEIRNQTLILWCKWLAWINIF